MTVAAGTRSGPAGLGWASVAAVDLGASSGRVLHARVGPQALQLTEMHRFPNGPRQDGDRLRWPIDSIQAHVLDGVAEVHRRHPLDGVGIDSWGVDYGLLSRDGELQADPVHYRDPRTTGVLDRVCAEVSAEEIYARTGTQFLPFNTLAQLLTEDPEQLRAQRMLLIPDLLGYRLTGRQVAEVTNASTTQLLDARTHGWDENLAQRVGLPPSVLPPLVAPGTMLGRIRPQVSAELAGVPVITVASHDTASAVVGAPMVTPDAAFISCGTWSLVGLELAAPVLTPESRRAGFTNEAGLDGTVRYLRNVMGLWLLQESLRTWTRQGLHPYLPDLLRRAAAEPAGRWVVDPDDPVLLPPGDIPSRITTLCRRSDGPVPTSTAAVVRCIVDSLAAAHARALADAQRVSGRSVDVVHLVGGGARNALLCQATADACGLPVVAGPVEAAAIGNALVQARALGALRGGLADLRAVVAATQQTRTYLPARSRTGLVGPLGR